MREPVGGGCALLLCARRGPAGGRGQHPAVGSPPAVPSAAGCAPSRWGAGYLCSTPVRGRGVRGVQSVREPPRASAGGQSCAGGVAAGGICAGGHGCEGPGAAREELRAHTQVWGCPHGAPTQLEGLPVGASRPQPVAVLGTPLSLGNLPGNAACGTRDQVPSPQSPLGTPRCDQPPAPCRHLPPHQTLRGGLWVSRLDPHGENFPPRGAQTWSSCIGSWCAGVPTTSRTTELSPASPLCPGAPGASSQGLLWSLLALCLPWDVSWAHGAPPAPVPCLTWLLGCECALCLRLGTADGDSRQPGRVAAAWAAPSVRRWELCGAPLSWSFLFSRHNYPPPSDYCAQQQPGGCGLLVCELRGRGTLPCMPRAGGKSAQQPFLPLGERRVPHSRCSGCRVLGGVWAVSPRLSIAQTSRWSCCWRGQTPGGLQWCPAGHLSPPAAGPARCLPLCLACPAPACPSPPGSLHVHAAAAAGSAGGAEADVLLPRGCCLLDNDFQLCCTPSQVLEGACAQQVPSPSSAFMLEQLVSEFRFPVRRLQPSFYCLTEQGQLAAAGKPAARSGHGSRCPRGMACFGKPAILPPCPRCLALSQPRDVRRERCQPGKGQRCLCCRAACLLHSRSLTRCSEAPGFLRCPPAG